MCTNPAALDYSLSPHATERILDMAVDPRDVREAIYHPDTAIPSRTHPGCNHRKGDLTLGISPDGTVTTALWSNNELWHADLDRAACAGRTARAVFGIN